MTVRDRMLALLGEEAWSTRAPKPKYIGQTKYMKPSVSDAETAKILMRAARDRKKSGRDYAHIVKVARRTMKKR